MKLNETQINTIDAVLEKSGVVYIDYKFEILDHIATEVEELMEERQERFEKAFAVVLEKWEPKFKIASGATFGYLWEIPEIFMQKVKKLYWQKMILLTLASFVLMGILLFMKKYLAANTQGVMCLLIALLVVQFIGYVKIRLSKYKTSFGFLYKQQFLAFLFMYFIPIHLLSNDERLFERFGDASFPIFFMIATLIIAPIMNFKFYKKHFVQIKRSTKLI